MPKLAPQHIGIILREWYPETSDNLAAGIRDLLTDIRHYCQAADLDYDVIDQCSAQSYAEEINGD